MMVQQSLTPKNEFRVEGVQNEPSIGSFKELLLASVDESFSSIGKSAKQRIYSHLQEHYDISRDEIPSRISDFAEALEESYNLYGKLIEIKIMKALYEKVGPLLYFPHGVDLSFASYVEMLRYLV
ncbi:MAG: hypothetical protein KGD70_16185 [Candidatus Lokiarchaeota archaeon]|nr:hypothetical protein [Candidatus Lokiarchaeota archaeon]